MPPGTLFSDLPTVARAPHRASQAAGLLLMACLGGAVPGAVAQEAPWLSPSPEPVAAPRAASVRPVDGLEINYDLLSDADAATSPGRLRGVVAVPHGRVVASVLVNPGSTSGERVTRLDTAWQTSLPHPVQTLVVGDTVGSGGGWSRPVRFGGVRFGRAPVLRAGDIDPGTPAPHSAAALNPRPFASHGVGDRALSAARELPDAAPAAARPRWWPTRVSA